MPVVMGSKSKILVQRKAMDRLFTHVNVRSNGYLRLTNLNPIMYQVTKLVDAKLMPVMRT